MKLSSSVSLHSRSLSKHGEVARPRNQRGQQELEGSGEGVLRSAEGLRNRDCEPSDSAEAGGPVENEGRFRGYASVLDLDGLRLREKQTNIRFSQVHQPAQQHLQAAQRAGHRAGLAHRPH